MNILFAAIAFCLGCLGVSYLVWHGFRDARLINRLRSEVHFLITAAPSEICKKYQYQACRHCNRLDCTANRVAGTLKAYQMQNRKRT